MSRNVTLNFTIVETTHYEAQMTVDLDRWAEVNGAPMDLDELDVDALRMWVETESIEVSESDGVVQGSEWVNLEPASETEAVPGSKKRAVDLVPGDRYVQQRGDDRVIVEIVGPQEPDENWFGLPWFKYLAKSGDRTGYVKFGPTGTVVLA